MIGNQIDIETYVSECCMAPLEDGVCMKCGKDADYRTLMIRGVTKYQTRTSWDAFGEWLIRALPTIVWILIGMLWGMIIGSNL